MWLQATFGKSDFEHIAERFLPMKLAIDTTNLFIARPTQLTFIPEVGVRIDSHAKAEITVVGIKMPVTVESAAIVIVPYVAKEHDREKLMLKLTLEELDLKYLPKFVDDTVADHIRESLLRPVFVWDFLETLDFDIPLPESVAPVKNLKLAAKWGAVKVSEDAITVACSFDASTVRLGKRDAAIA